MSLHTSLLRLIGLLGLLAILGGCGGGTTSDSLESYKNQKLVWDTCPSDILSKKDQEKLTAKGITLEQFGPRLTCTRMRAPLDYANPGRGELQVAFMRIAAQDQRRHDGIFFNPGGPGGDGLILAPLFADAWSRDGAGALYQQMAHEFDLIGFSPRGTGASTQLTCDSNEFYPFYGTELDRSSGNIAAMLTAAKQRANACANNPLTPYINTEATARDLDLMRELSGYDKLNYYGMSYGTWLGHWYAGLFPERVGAMLLSGIVDLTRGLEETYLEQPMGYQRTFDKVIAPYADRNQNVFFSEGSATPRLAGIFASLSSRPFLQAAASNAVAEDMGSSSHASSTVLAMVAAHWLASKLDSLPGQEVEKETAVRADIESASIASGNLDPGDTNQANTLNIRARDLASKIAIGYFVRLNAQANGELDPVKIGSFEALNFTVVSNDYPTNKTIDEWIAKTNLNVASYPLIGGKFTNWPGLFWKGPVVTRPSFENAKRANGFVVLHTEYDAFTPREGAEASLTILPNASYISIASEYTHGVSVPYGQSCVDEPIARYFMYGTLPGKRIKCEGNLLPWDRASN